MKNFLIITAFGFLIGCGDKDEDTGSAAEEALDTSESDSE